MAEAALPCATGANDLEAHENVVRIRGTIASAMVLFLKTLHRCFLGLFNSFGEVTACVTGFLFRFAKAPPRWKERAELGSLPELRGRKNKTLSKAELWRIVHVDSKTNQRKSVVDGCCFMFDLYARCLDYSVQSIHTVCFVFR